MFFEWLCDEKVKDSLKDGLNDVLDSNDKGENIIITSVITDVEVVPSKLDSKMIDASSEYNELFDSEKFHPLEVTKNIIATAREIRDYYYVHADSKGKGGKMMDLGDSIHLASAIIFKADEFHTRDGNEKGSKVPILGIYEYSGVDKICGKYPLKITSPEAEQGRLL